MKKKNPFQKLNEKIMALKNKKNQEKKIDEPTEKTLNPLKEEPQ